MQLTKFRLIAYSLLVTFVWQLPAFAQITEYTWTSGSGSGLLWQQNGNWDQADFPNDPQHVANLSVPLGGNLTVNVGTTGNDVTVAGLTMGGTSGMVTTDITSSGALLRIQNDFVQDLANADFSNNSIVDGADFLAWQAGFGMTNQENNANGDANSDETVDGADLIIWEDNYGLSATGISGGRGIITTVGVAGSTNQISSGVRLVNELVDVVGVNDLVINGPITYENAAPVEGTIDASFSNTSAGITTTINGGINLSNQSGGVAGLVGLNTSQNSQGTLIVNGVIDDSTSNASDLNIGVQSSSARMPLNTVRLTAANTYNGTTRIGRVNLELANDQALGFDAAANMGMGAYSTIRQAGPANQFGYNIIAVGGDRTIQNNMVVAQWQTFKGSNNITWAGDIIQTNNRGFVNQLEEGATLTLTGLIEVFEDDGGALERDFEFDGTGRTVISGTGRIESGPTSGGDRRILKSGTGVLLIDVAANANTVPATVVMGNLHYANNASLGGTILSIGGAVGVDTGVASNTTFANTIDPTSTGGLMLAASDAAAPLNFTTTLANAANMTVAAPETGLTYTGTITPANSTYGLGGGTGTLTLPNAQLTGANSVEVRNGGTVELLGDNTYTGSTTVISKYTSSHQEQAEADSSNENDATGIFLDRLVSPTLVVDDLANGGVASSIGSASSAAENLFIHASTLKYVGTGDSTNRLFTIGTGGATIDSSGTGAVVFSNTGALGRDDADDHDADLDDQTGNPNVASDIADTSDIIIGMSVSDPDAGFTGVFGTPPAPCASDGSGCIPVDTEVSGVSDDGMSIGLSNNFAPNINKQDTRLVFGTVERTLTLAGSNADNNELASVIGDSPMGGVVAVDKVGSGKWILSGANTYTGDTTVGEGILSLTSAFLDDDAAVNIDTGGILNLDTSGATDIVDALFLDGVEQDAGLWGAIGNGAATFTTALITGSGLLNVGGAALANLTSVPEPSTLVLAGLACLGMGGRRRKVLA